MASSAQCFAPHVADAAVLARIAPGPAEAIVKQFEGFASPQRADNLRPVRGSGAQVRVHPDMTGDRLGVVRRNHAPGEGDVGEVLAIGIG